MCCVDLLQPCSQGNTCYLNAILQCLVHTPLLYQSWPQNSTNGSGSCTCATARLRAPPLAAFFAAALATELRLLQDLPPGCLEQQERGARRGQRGWRTQESWRFSRVEVLEALRLTRLGPLGSVSMLSYSPFGAHVEGREDRPLLLTPSLKRSCNCTNGGRKAVASRSDRALAGHGQGKSALHKTQWTQFC